MGGRAGVVSPLPSRWRRFSPHRQAELTAIEAAANEVVAEHEAIRKELEATKKQFTAFERQDIKLREDIK